MKLIQIERSGSGQTAYWPTASQPEITLDQLEGEVIERPDLADCVQGLPQCRVVQVKSGGAYAGTAGRIFAVPKQTNVAREAGQITQTITFAESVIIQADGDLSDSEFRKYIKRMAGRELEKKETGPAMKVSVDEMDGDVMPFGMVETAMLHAFKCSAKKVTVSIF